jgi:hypothetical protein
MPLFPFEIRNVTGPPYTIGNTQITPHSQVFRLAIRMPFGGGGFIWNRPVAITVNDAIHPVQQLPVVDITRLAQIGILALGIFGAMIISRRIRND